MVPSVSPTIFASFHPSFITSAEPSTSFSEKPNVVPSIEPTILLSDKPTYLLSFHPSFDPTMSSSAGPTSKLTHRPQNNLASNKPTFRPESNSSSNVPTSVDNDDRSTSGAMLIGGISAGVGFLGFLALGALIFRQRRSEESIVNTLGSDKSMTSFPQSSHLPTTEDSNRDSAASRANETFSTDPSGHNHDDDTEGNENTKDVTLCNFSYSEDSSEVFKDLGMSLTSSSAESSRISRFSFSDIDVNRCTPDTFHAEGLPLQQLRPETNVVTPINRHNENIEQDSISLGEASKLKTEVLQPESKSLARLLSCFSSTSLLNNNSMYYPDKKQIAKKFFLSKILLIMRLSQEEGQISSRWSHHCQEEV